MQLSESCYKWQEVQVVPCWQWCPTRLSASAFIIILCVNDIPDLVDPKIKMFADDIKIYAESFLMLYKTYIRPHLEYCVSIWNPYLGDTTESQLVPELTQLPFEAILQHHNLYTPCTAGDKEWTW